MKKLLKKIVCFFVGHVVNEGRYIDRHGLEDYLSFCERCGKYDV